LLFGEHTRRLCFFAHGCAQEKKERTKKTKFRNCQQPARSQGHRAQTYTQKTVEIDAARLERTVEVINRVLDRVIFSNEVDESVWGFVRYV
jgi:hypothetical protein